MEGTAMYLSERVSPARLREAENARRNRAEFIKALSDGTVRRRDLIKWGLFTAAGTLALKNGLSPFAKSAYADSNIPTGFPPSPLFGVQPFTMPLYRFDVLARNPNPFTFLSPTPTAESNQTKQYLNPALEGVRPGDKGPIEGRPPGPIWAHQGFDDPRFAPQIAVEASQAQATTNTVYNPQVESKFNSYIDPRTSIPLKFHPGLPTQGPNAVWT